MRLVTNNLGYLYMIFAAVLWGTTGTAQAFAPDGATPLAVGALRLLIGGGLLLAVAYGRAGYRVFLSIHPRPFFLGSITVALYQVCFFAAVLRTGVVAGTLVAIGSAPIFSGLLGWLVRGEVLRWRWYVATLLAVAGTAMLLLTGGRLQVDVLGVGLALGAGLSYALYALASKALLDDLPADVVMAAIFGFGALLLLPVLRPAQLGWIATSSGALVVLHLGVFATALAYALFGRGLRLLPLSTTGTLSLIEPLTAGLLGVLVLGERLAPLAWAGLLLVLLGLFLLVSEPNNPGNSPVHSS